MRPSRSLGTLRSLVRRRSWKDEAFWEERRKGMRLEYEMSRELRSEPIQAAAPRSSPTGLELPDVDWSAFHRATVAGTAEIQRDEPELIMWAIRRVLDAGEPIRN